MANQRAPLDVQLISALDGLKKNRPELQEFVDYLSKMEIFSPSAFSVYFKRYESELRDILNSPADLENFRKNDLPFIKTLWIILALLSRDASLIDDEDNTALKQLANRCLDKTSKIYHLLTLKKAQKKQSQKLRRSSI